MKKTVIITLLLGLCQTLLAQIEITYFHDSSKKNQITVMETGIGSLTPGVYYELLHKDYSNSAASTNKNNLRLSATLSSHKQVEYADSIKTSLESRAKEEEINILDRKIDVAWQAEGNKLDNKILAFKNNINQLSGKCSAEELQDWQELGECYSFAVRTLKMSYMPNSERQKQYLALSEDVTKKNDMLLNRVKILTYKHKADLIMRAMSGFNHRVQENSAASYNRWRDASKKIITTNR